MSTRRLGAILALVTLLTAACTAGPGTGGTLEGTRWVLSAMDQDGELLITPETVFADAEFAVHRVAGFAGCNTYDSVYTAGGRTLLVSAPATTLMACDEATMAFEARYLELLQASRHYTARRDTLTVFDADRREILRFDAAPRNPLLGTWDVAGYGVPPSTVVGIVEGTRMTAIFGIGSVGGFAGCNSYSGTAGTNGTVVRISKLATTQIACEQEVMDQEAAFLAALEGASHIDDRGTTLNLTDRQGRLLVALQRPSPEAASPAPGASGEPTTRPTATAAPSPTAAPTATPTPKPSPTTKPTATPKPTAKPTAQPTATPAPTAAPSSPPVIPPTATCNLLATGGAAVASIVYPGTWSTLTEPPELACRFFDPAPIEAPADPATLDTAVRADPLTMPYADAVASATDTATWTVALTSAFEVRGIAVTCVAATALVDADGVATGTGRYACLADVGSAGTVAILTVGSPTDPAFLSNSAVVGLMTLASTFTPAG